ncbi:MAG TPA: hypothetical protein PK108_03115 [Pyrinomonadaceae bacterium]|nr:hypothetical protein [Pyrinomonadaceae bacterium]
MDLKRTKLNILRKKQDLSDRAKTGVSLHCHTEYSKEMLDFVPHYASKLPIIAYFWRRERDRYLEREGHSVDFSSAYWSPPLTPQMVYDIESAQIGDANLDSFVSLTDHDHINGNYSITDGDSGKLIPISMEWTVPYEYGYFHLGVHNLPKHSATEITKLLLDYTFNVEVQNTERLNELFSMLHDLPHVLVILNHPIWDIEMAGAERHDLLLKDFLRVHGRWIHALEINGFRSWSENKAVIEMAEALGIPVATGGDRHGCKPNTVINLTRAETFEEFVEEIRIDKRSEVALMPEYEQPLHSRQLQSFSEILSHYPDFAEHRQRWFDRVFYDRNDGQGVVPLSSHGWDRGGPAWLRIAVKTLGFFGSPAVRPVFRAVRKKKDRIPSSPEATEFEIPQLDDISGEFSSEPV